MRTLLSVVSLMLAGSPCLAQGSASSPDTTAILQAIQGIKDELKATNKRIDRLQERDRSPSARPATATQTAPAAAPSAGGVPAQAQQGWQIYLEPWAEDGKGYAVMSFPGPLNDFSFDLHSRYAPSQNRYVYHGVSTFHPKEYGDYTFALTLMPVLLPTPTDAYTMTRFNCSGELRVNENVLIATATAYPSTSRRAEKAVLERQDYYGRTILEPPKPGQGHVVEYRVDCWPDNFKKTTYFDFLLSSWKLNQFQVRVKGPGDMGPRPFRPEELYYVAKR